MAYPVTNTASMPGCSQSKPKLDAKPIMTEQCTLDKVRDMQSGKVVTMSNDELDLLASFDRSNVIRTRPNPTGQWECWIERRDLERITT